MKNRLAIQILSYNKPHYLKQTLESLIPRMDKRDKLCVIEQSDKKEVQEECLDICGQFSDIRVISLSKNLGQRGATNITFESGFFEDSEFIMLSDHDNLFHEDLSVYCDRLNDSPMCWIATGYHSPEHDVENKDGSWVLKSTARAGHMVLRQKDFLSLCPLDINFGNVGHATNDYGCAWFCGLDWLLTHWNPKTPGYKRPEFIHCFPGGVTHEGRDSSWQNTYDDEYDLETLKWMQTASLYDIIKKYPPRHTYQKNTKYWYEKLPEDQLKLQTDRNPPIKESKDLPRSKVMNENIDTDELKQLIKDKLGIDLEGQELKITRSPLKKNESEEESKFLVAGQKSKEYDFSIDDINLKVYDYERSQTPSSIIKELKDDIYGFSKMDFNDGDIVVDLGANIGIFSMYLAKKFPFIKIYSFEPSYVNYQHLLKGLEVNNIKNIIPFNLAITKDGRDVISVASDQYSGGAMIFEKGSIDVHQEEHYIINDTKSITINSILKDNNIEVCKLLKMDIEGFEHEVVPTISSFNIIYFSGEFHYRGSQELLKYIEEFVLKDNINVKIEKPNIDRPKGAVNTLKKIKSVVSGKPDNVKDEISRLTNTGGKKIIAFNYIWPEYGIAFLESSIRSVLSYVYEYHLFINEESYVGAKASKASIKELRDIVDKIPNVILHYDGPSKAAKIDNITHYFKRIISLVKDYADYVWMVQSDEIYDEFGAEDVVKICNNDEINACAVVQPICYFDTPHWFINPPEVFTRPTIIKVSNPDFNSKKNFDITFHHNSYVLTREELRLKFENWGHRDNVKENKNRFWDIFDVIKTNKFLKNIHPIQPPIYSGVGHINNLINKEMFLDWVHYLINHSEYDAYSKRYENTSDYDLSINQRKFISSIVSEMIPSNGLYVEMGMSTGWNLMLISQISRDLTIVGFEQDEEKYKKTYQKIMRYNLLNNINAFYGTPKFVSPKFINTSIDCVFINKTNSVKELRSSVFEIWPKLKNFSIMCGLYDRNDNDIVSFLNNTITDAVRIQCPWGEEMFRFYETYIDLFGEIEKYKNVDLKSDTAVWFARVRKS